MTVLIFMVTMIGIILFTYFDDSPGVIIFSLLLSILMTSFCIIDAKDRGFRLPWSTYWLFFLFWPVAVPIYLFVSRKGKWKLTALAYIASYLILCVLTLMVAVITLPWSAYYVHDHGEYKLAIRLYSSLISEDDNDAWAHCNRGRAYEAIGLESEAEKDYQIARTLDPTLFENE